MNGKDREALLELPFDQYQRYRLLADLVDVLDREKSFRILEVGGAPVRLPDFLPGHRVTVTDRLEDSHSSYTRADAMDLPFPDRSFDLVASLDTLEHIMPERRAQFLEELARVSNNLVVLAAPFRSRVSQEAEEMIFGFIRAHLGYEHAYFKEHLERGLPDMVETESYFVSQNFHTLILPNGRLDRWIMMMFVYYYLEGDAAYAELNRKLSAFYNRNYYASDNVEPAYRHFIVASREGLAESGERVQALAGSEPGPAPDLEPVRALIELARLDREKVLKNKVAELEDLLEARGSEIAGLRDQVEELEGFARKTRENLFYKVYKKFFKRRKS